ncbi:MAG: hypothetical protein LC754_04130 [Acidobacteria bacterium]|nr:hypothetical protein [Acidobacteriota bacterium]
METVYPTVERALQRYYTVADRLLLMVALDEWSAQIIEHFFSGWYVSPCEAEGKQPSCTSIKLRCNSEPPSVPQGLDYFEIAGGGYCHTDGRISYLEIEGSLIIVNAPPAAEINVWLREDFELQSPLLALVFSYAISAAFRRCGLLELHCGGVIEPERGTGALIVGASGSGKSTLTTQLAASGWSYLSDDVTLLNERAGWIEGRGLRKCFALTSDTLGVSAIPELRSLMPDVSGEFKHRLAPQQYFPAGYASSCRPRAIFFKEVTPARETHLRELSQSEAMACLIKMCPWACYDRPTADEQLRLIARLVKQCIAFELAAGRDLLDDPEYAPRLLGSCLRNRIS